MRPSGRSQWNGGQGKLRSHSEAERQPNRGKAMRMKWGRGERTGGPSIRPAYTYVLVLISFIATLGNQGFRYKRVWTPLERHYFPDYVSSQIVGVVRDNARSEERRVG